MLDLLWWNVGNLFDDVDDPHTGDLRRSGHAYRRDLRELAEVITTTEPYPTILGMAEVENQRVLHDLSEELRWQRGPRDLACPRHIDSRDPRGIDVGMLMDPSVGWALERYWPAWPADHSAVRPVVIAQIKSGTHRLRLALLHAKSRRSGASHRHDPTPGSKLRLAYGRLLRSLATDAYSDGVPFIAMGDFNDGPDDHALVIGAGALPLSECIEAHRLYNLSTATAGDVPGTHWHRGHWQHLDQVLVSGNLLGPSASLRVAGPLRILSHGPLLHKGRPNRWYSDHLPVTLSLTSGHHH